ncbi:hypothetical protein CHUAL_013972 [Chamberlinius hualienensis]
MVMKLATSGNGTSNILKVYVDASWGNSIPDRKSYSGYIAKWDNGIISWKSGKQKSVALSTMEAEYMALSEAVKEAVWLKRIIDSSVLSSGKPIVPILYCDNSATRAFMNSPIENHRTKHIDIRYQYAKDHFANNMYDLQPVTSQENDADFLTKPMTSVVKNRMLPILFAKTIGKGQEVEKNSH